MHQCSYFVRKHSSQAEQPVQKLSRRIWRRLLGLWRGAVRFPAPGTAARRGAATSAPPRCRRTRWAVSGGTSPGQACICAQNLGQPPMLEWARPVNKTQVLAIQWQGDSRWATHLMQTEARPLPRRRQGQWQQHVRHGWFHAEQRCRRLRVLHHPWFWAGK